MLELRNARREGGRAPGKKPTTQGDEDTIFFREEKNESE